MSTTPNVSIAPAPIDFDAVRAAVKRRFAAYSTLGPLFRTDAAHLATAFRCALPEPERQVHYCFTCMDFFSRYGGLVHINDDGSTTPVFWSQDEAAPGYEGAVAAVDGLVRRAKVTGLFASAEPWLGKGQTGEWTHFTVQNPRVEANPVAVEANARENRKMLSMSLHDYPVEVVRNALAMLRSGTIYRAEKALSATAWFADLHARLEEVKHRDIRENLIWRAPSPSHSIDRINTNGNYEPGNVRWATPTQQARNHRNNRVLTVGGVARSAAEWADLSGINYRTIMDRLFRGWPEDKAVALPKGAHLR